MKYFNILLFFYLLISLQLSAQAPRQVLDITPGAASTFTDANDRMLGVVAGSKILFLIHYSNTRKEIWVSDGGQAGTQKLLDLEGAILQSVIPYQKGLLLIAQRNSKSEIWFSDGSQSGTRLLFETPQTLYLPVLYKDALYYASKIGDLFGTRNGLYALPLNAAKYEANRIYEFEDLFGIRQLIALPNRLIGIASVTGQGQQLFSSDGTRAGTKPYFQIEAGTPNSPGSPIYATPLDNKLLFFYQTTFNGLYSTDGTAAGTKLLGRYKEHIFQKPYLETRTFFSWEGKFYFSADTLSSDPFSSEVLNVTDGTPTATRRIIPSSEVYFKPTWFTPYKGALYFRANNDFGIEYLCVTKGTRSTTGIAVDHFALGEGGSFGGDYISVFRDSLFFSAYRREVGIELWRSNGLTRGTKNLDLLPGRTDSWPQQLMVAGDKLFFTAISALGRELWVYDPLGTTTAAPVVSTLEAKLSLAPNPVSTRLHIQAESAEILDRFAVYDLLGRPQLQRKLNSQSITENIDLATWPKGLYTLELWGKNGARKVEKFIVQ